MKRGWIYHFICFAVRLFVRRPLVSGLEKFVQGRGSIIAGNHEGAWGPVVTRAWFALPTAPWVNWQITRKGYCKHFLSGFIFTEQAHMKGWVARPLSVLVEPLLLRLLRAGDAVPVYFGDTRVAITYKKSIDMLKAGKTLMVFPDNESTLQDLYVPDFHDGYLATAKLYHKLTGEKLLIYPLCLSSRRNLIALGEPVEFNPDTDFKAECKRINAHLLAFIRERYSV